MGEPPIVGEIRSELRELADPVLAPGQQAYMKSAMPFRGVRVPDVRRVARTAARSHGIRIPDAAIPAALILWDEAAYREERYAAMALLAVRGVDGNPAIIPVIEHFVRTGRWWDFTDELAHRFPPLLERDPAGSATLLRGWSTDDDMWIRRVAIIAQLGRNDEVDRALLADVIAPNLADSEFFVRKAIGWALREVARVDPAWVRAYADAHDLSPLSRREALKHL